MKKQQLRIQTFSTDFISLISVLCGFLILGCVTTSQASVDKSTLLSTSITQLEDIDENNLQANIHDSETNFINNPYDQISKETGILPFLEESFVIISLDMQENNSIVDLENNQSTGFDPYTTQIFNENHENENMEKNPSLLNLPHNREDKTSLKMDVQTNKIDNDQNTEQLKIENKTPIILPTQNSSQLSVEIPKLSTDIDTTSDNKTPSPIYQQENRTNDIDQQQEASSQLSQFTVSAFVNEKIPIKIEGEGWSLNEDFDSSLKFLQKEYSPTNQSVFYIQAKTPGEYSLLFSRMTIGAMEEQVVLLKINPYNSSTEQKKTNIVPTNPKNNQDFSLKTDNANKKHLSLQNNLDNNNSYMIPQASKKGKIAPKIIGKKNLTPIDSSLENSQPIDVLPFKSSILKEKNIPNDLQSLDLNSLKALFDESLQKKTPEDLNMSIKAGQAFVERFPGNIISAKIFYELGQLFEKKTPEMDRKVAYNYYQKSYKNYPLSPYSRLSKERMLHLEQFYLRLP